MKTADARLTVYSRHFPCVEVDTSTYAIPSPETTARWASAVSKGFVFHFKAYGILCGQSQPISNLPQAVRSQLPHELQQVRDPRQSGRSPGHTTGRAALVAAAASTRRTGFAVATMACSLAASYPGGVVH